MIHPLIVNIFLDRSFAMMENRGLTFLLRGEAYDQYQQFLNRPVEYRDYIRYLVKDDWWKDGQRKTSTGSTNGV